MKLKVKSVEELLDKVYDLLTPDDYFMIDVSQAEEFIKYFLNKGFSIGKIDVDSMSSEMFFSFDEDNNIWCESCYWNNGESYLMTEANHMFLMDDYEKPDDAKHIINVIIDEDNSDIDIDKCKSCPERYECDTYLDYLTGLQPIKDIEEDDDQRGFSFSVDRDGVSVSGYFYSTNDDLVKDMLNLTKELYL